MKKIIVIIGIVLLLVFIVFPLLTKAGGGFIPKEVLSKEVTCNADLSNPAFNSVKINSATCSITGSCIKPFYITQGFSLFSDAGILTLKTSDSQAKVDYKINEFQSSSYSIKTCTNQNSGTLTTTNDNGGNTDLRSVSW